MAKKEYVFDNTKRKPTKGITVYGRTIGENEIHLQYAPAATSCKFPGAATYTSGQCLLTDKSLYFVSNALKKERRYLEIPLSRIERVRKTLLNYLIISVDAFEYTFSLVNPLDWMEDIARMKEATHEENLDIDEEDDDIVLPSPADEEETVQVKRFCPGCGAKVENGDLFCSECGKPLK